MAKEPEPVEWNAASVVERRTSSGEPEVSNQLAKVKLTKHAVRVAMRAAGKHGPKLPPIETDAPAVVRHYRAMDAQTQAIAYAGRNVEPRIRERGPRPFVALPGGMVVCPVCEGAGTLVNESECWLCDRAGQISRGRAEEWRAAGDARV